MRNRVGAFSKIWILVLSVIALGIPLWLWQASSKADSINLPAEGAYFGVSNVDAQTAADLEQAIGRSFAVQRIYSDEAAPNILNGNSEVQDASLHSRIPWLSIKTADWQKVAEGQRDKDIDKLASSIKTFGQPMILTVNYEPEDELNTSGNTASNYIALWRRYVDRFAQQGVVNVTWAWVVKASSLSNGDPLFAGATSVYPGDEYVDIIGVNAHNAPYDPAIGYDYCKANGQNEPKAKDTADIISDRSKYPCQADYYAMTVLDVQWANLKNLISPAYQWATTSKPGSHNVPMAVAEYGSTYDWRSDPRRADWITAARQDIKSMPLIKIINYAQYPEWKLGWPSENQGNDIRAFTEMGQDAYYQPDTTPLPPPDTTPPVVQIVSPTDGTYRGTIQGEVLAEDNVGIDRVSFLTNGVWRVTDYEAPYGFETNTTIEDNGEHELTAVAYDLAGNMGESNAVDIVVDNVLEQAPVITSFIAQPSSITTGQTTVLSWEVTGSAGCSIVPDGPQNVQETSWITPIQLHAGIITYELTCTNQYGASSQELDVTVTAVPTPPEKPIFGASSTQIKPGDDVLFGWSSKGATSCQLNPGGIVSVGGSASRLVEDIHSTTTFTLDCYNDAGQTTADPITIQVTNNPVAQPPEILVFKAEPDKVASGQTSTVTWQTMNVMQNGCNITPSAAKAIPANGSVVTPPLTSSRSFTLTCVNSVGQAATAGLTITVDDIPPPEYPAPTPPETSNDQTAPDALGVSEELLERITKVEYYVDGTLAQTYTQAPITFDNSQYPPGTYTVTQRVYFNDGSIAQRTLVVTIPAPLPESLYWSMAVVAVFLASGCLWIRDSYKDQINQ